MKKGGREGGGEGRRQRGRERRLLKVGGKFGSAAKLTQLSSPLLKRNFASPNSPSTSSSTFSLRCAALSPSLPSSPSVPPSHSSSRAVSIRHSGRLSEGVNSVFWDYRFCCYYYYYYYFLFFFFFFFHYFFYLAHATSGVPRANRRDTHRSIDF